MFLYFSTAVVGTICYTNLEYKNIMCVQSNTCIVQCTYIKCVLFVASQVGWFPSTYVEEED